MLSTKRYLIFTLSIAVAGVVAGIVYFSLTDEYTILDYVGMIVCMVGVVFDSWLLLTGRYIDNK